MKQPEPPEWLEGETAAEFLARASEWGAHKQARAPLKYARRQTHAVMVLLIVSGLALTLISTTGRPQAVGIAVLTGGILGEALVLVQMTGELALESRTRDLALALAGADLTGASFIDWPLIRQPYFRGRTLDHAYLAHQKFLHNGADFSYSKLRYANFKECVFGDGFANFCEADCSDALFEDALLPGALFVMAHCERTRFQGAQLSGADFRKASLTGAVLRGADLTGANLRGADLTDADLADARLSDVISDKSTIWPQDFDPGRSPIRATQ